MIHGLEQTGLRSISGCYETAPVGPVAQRDFLNLVAGVETALEHWAFLGALKEIENRAGRTPSARWGPRTIDIDIILFGSLVLTTEELTIPHKEFRHRAFVLAPLAEIAAGVFDPETGKAVSQLLAELPGGQDVRLTGIRFDMAGLDEGRGG